MFVFRSLYDFITSFKLKADKSSGRTFLDSACDLKVVLSQPDGEGIKLGFTHVNTDGGSRGLSFP